LSPGITNQYKQNNQKNHNSFHVLAPINKTLYYYTHISFFVNKYLYNIGFYSILIRIALNVPGCKRRFASPYKQTVGLQGWQTVAE
jgi:hypothetical protein